jgi:hypothetical protein
MDSKQGTDQDIRKRFGAAGFEIVASGQKPGAFGVKKHNCLLFLTQDLNGVVTPSGPPYFIVQGLNCELEDRGYQKFWYHNGKRFPVRLADLKALHQFDEEVRSLLGWTSLYHESLGTTSARSVYDRLAGRPD